ncbi:MAG TPA: ASKHA domain-containing protein, partial [Actinomycetota bacterium]
EATYRARRGLDPERRLGCHARMVGDLVIDVPPDSQLHRQVVRKPAEARAIELDPVVRLCYVEVERPSLGTQTSDHARLLQALEREWGLTGLTTDAQVVVGLQAALRTGDWAVTVAVHDGDAVTAVWPGFRDLALGIAFDVGSTTVAGHLCDLATGEVLASAGAMNPQIRFGEDLMSRVSYLMLNPGATAALTRAVRGCLNDLAATLAADAGRDPADVLEVTLVGNPVMHHLLLGVDPTELGGAPFALATDQALRLRAASDLELAVHPGARAYVLPCVAGHVGADTAGVLLAEAPYQRGAVSLLVDVGTNAEIVLGGHDRLLAASSPTGPAFEGAQISAGQRAAPGAVERVRVDRDTLEPRLRVIGNPAWSDQPGFDPAAVSGICGSGIIEAVAELYLAGVVTADGVIDGGAAARSPRVVRDGRTHAYVLHDRALQRQPILVTQNDIRQIQLAKAALHAGCRLLMDRLGVDSVDRVRLAGAFGAQIDPVHALVLGMVPDCDPAAVSSAGNAAGTGARIALLSGRSRHEVEEAVRRVEKVETAVEPRFQEHFVDAMAIPHRRDPYARLARAVPLPERDPRARPRARTRTRRRTR